MFNTMIWVTIAIFAFMIAGVAYDEIINESEEYADYIIVNGITYVAVSDEED